MQKSKAQIRCEEEVELLMRSNRRQYRYLEDVAPKVAYKVQRGQAPGMRLADLSKELTAAYLNTPITEDLLCTQVGHHQAVGTHYIHRPNGSDDTILLYSTNGQGWIEIEEQSYTVAERDALLIPSSLPHKYGSNPDAPWAPYWVHFQGRQTAAYTKLLAKPAGTPVFHLSHRQEITIAIEQVFKQMSHVHTYANLLATSGALSHLLSLIHLRMRAAEPRSRSVDENLDKTIEFMHRNVSEKFSLSELAKLAHLSPNHFGALFLKRFQSTPIDYFNRLKIQRACELLTTTQLSVAEVGEALGFSDPFYFSRLFKKVMGKSPRAYR
ncbi:helix-turn-helix domain-containing protein [Pelagicoccus sp. SDUM812003]|uniref:helix-turn-helix domain-containing protein n=1 Tax=Pelagicoccus sp. SDUM812003 TaxID=3041267 RepID=UPI00280EC7BE|nr:helix-turn-helix domain-containing protein [Pelagicoccus sp. SDUM812003]MDQ8201426.1 helix-turn-helix domain-containing protein [Pelagicoccus sp. SDUM812003]